MQRVYQSKLFYMIDWELLEDNTLMAEVAVFHQCPPRFSIILDGVRYYASIPKDYQTKNKLLVTKLSMQLVRA